MISKLLVIALAHIALTNAFIAIKHQKPIYTTTLKESFAEQALTISAATSSLRDKIVVVKYGGNAMTSPELAKSFCEDVAALQKLGIKVVVVHGGGPQISKMLEKVNVETRFEGGMRVSSSAVVEVGEWFYPFENVYLTCCCS